MDNERGITLAELLVVLAIVGIIITLIVSVLINGMNASERNTTKQRLQQEANYIVETIRNHYLINENENLILIVVDGSLLIDDPKIASDFKGVVISNDYKYEFNCVVDNESKECISSEQKITIPRVDEYALNLRISKGDFFYDINTTLSKLH